MPASRAAALCCLLVCLLPVCTARGEVRLGIDTLRDTGFSAVTGKTIGLVTNQTSTDASGQRDRVILGHAPGVKLTTLFTPEHGLDGTELAGKYVPSRRDPVTGLPAFSLYGTTPQTHPRHAARTRRARLRLAGRGLPLLHLSLHPGALHGGVRREQH